MLFRPLNFRPNGFDILLLTNGSKHAQLWRAKACLVKRAILLPGKRILELPRVT